MVTLFSLPKPFLGETGRAQAVALESWCRLGDGVQVVVLGDEAGIAEATAAAGAIHIAEVARTAHGTPRLDDAFARVDAIAEHPLRLFVNADIVLLPDVLAAARAVPVASPSLLVGETWELRVALADLDDPWALRSRALREGRRRGAVAMDWFLFPAGLFDPMPAFAVGRASFDNWMIWRARQVGRAIDATGDVVAIHQPHGYDHLPAGKAQAYYGDEALENLRLGGGKRHRYTLFDASHRLRDGRIRRNPGATLRARETVRRAAHKLGFGG